jgi:UDP:flavonoid glycosyltransferase YjiC (YdhE family)
VRIAVCSLSQFTYLAEFVDVAQRLNGNHEVCYFLGFSCPDAIGLLERKQVPCQVLLDEQADIGSVLTAQAAAKSTYDLFKTYFFKHAELVLPDLIEELRAWKPDLILSYLRDYAGMTAAEVLGIPMVSFGSLPSPVRIEGIDPPFGAGVSKDAPERMLQLMWKLHHEFNSRVDPLYNEIIRRPYGLDDVRGASTLHSSRLVLLGTIPILSNKRSPDPPYVKYVGSLFSGDGAPAEPDEADKIAHIASSPRPRVFVTLGTTYVQPLLDDCLKALTDFPGTIVVTLGSQWDQDGDGDVRSLVERKNVIWRPFFSSFDRVLELVDAVVTVSAAKTVLASLAAGKPLVCLPQQGEQYERAYRLQALGAAQVPCPRRWDGERFARATEQVATDHRYRQAASALQAHVERSGGVDEAVRLLNKGGQGRSAMG